MRILLFLVILAKANVRKKGNINKNAFYTTAFKICIRGFVYAVYEL